MKKISIQFLLKSVLLFLFIHTNNLFAQCPLGTSAGSNLITNGDFSAGNTGFTTGYTNCNSANCLYPLADNGYSIGNSANFFHTSFTGIDHTNGSGNMMIINGGIAPSVWCQHVTVTPNTTYVFSAWVCTVFASNFANLNFSINGNSIGTIAAPTTTGTWIEFSTSWNSCANTSIDICINDLNISSAGNDFGLDDISLQACSCNPIVANAGPDVTICKGANSTLTASGGEKYIWNTGEKTASITVHPNSNATYYVTTSDTTTFRDGTTKIKAGKSCKTILDQGFSTGSGNYWIDPNEGSTSDAFQTYCDMTTDGGGWTKITPAVPSSTSLIDLVRGCSGKQMVKCSDASTHYIISPSTSLNWSWSIKQLAPGNWNVDGTSQPCGSDPEFNSPIGGSCPASTGWGYGCSNGGGTQNKFYGGQGNNSVCNDSVAHTNLAFSTPCTGTSVSANATYSIFIRSEDASPAVCGPSHPDSVNVIVNSVTASIIGKDTICKNQSTTLTASGGGTYLWSTSETAASINVSPTSDHDYSVVATNGGCQDSAKIKVRVNPSPTADFEISSDDCSVAFKNTSTGAVSYLWDFGDGTTSTDETPKHSYMAASSYHVNLTATSDQGCIDTFSVSTEIKGDGTAMFIPNTFTPNGDGVNDIFKVGSTALSQFEATIFNRWGEKVVSWSDSKMGWDGTKNGKLVPEGTYVYIIKGKNLCSGVEYESHGMVVLLR